jgi:alpha-1,2-mannosyltransferase
VTLVGLTSLVVSPVSWVHHAVWVVPALGVVLGDGRDRRRVAGAIAVAVLYLLRLPDWSSSVGAPVSDLYENAYLLGFLVLLFALPIGRPSLETVTDPVGTTAAG